MGSGKKIFAGVAWSTLVTIVNAIYGFFSAPLLINYLGKADYGLIGLATSINGYMAIMDMGLNSTSVRFFSVWLAKGDEGKVQKLMQTCTAFYGSIGLINALVLLIVYYFSGTIFNVTPEQDAILKQLLIVLACMALVNWYTATYTQLISATENVAWIQKRTLLTKLLMVVVLLSTVFFKLSVVEFVIGTNLVTLIILPLTIRKIRIETPFVKFHAKFDKQTFKEILPYSFNIFSFGIFQFTFQKLRVVLLGMQCTPVSITDYNVMGALAGLASMLSGVFMASLIPSASRVVAQGNREKYNQIAYQGTKFITISLCFCVFGLMTVDSDLMYIYVGESFMHLIPWLNIWLLCMLGGHNQCISSLILAGADIRAIRNISAFSSLIGLVVTWFAIPIYDSGGLVIGLCVYSAIQILFYWLYYWPKKMDIDSKKVVFQSFLPYVFVGGCITLGLQLIPHSDNHWLNVILFGGIFAVLYLVGIIALFNRDDRQFIMSILKRKSH